MRRYRFFPLAAAAALAVVLSLPLFVKKQADPEPSEPGTVYRLREYQGKLAVFLVGESDPQQIIDLDIRLLPPYDQGQLRTGIPAQGEAELARLIEDYTS